MYVYFIKAGQKLKIGKAKDPELRMAELQTGCPFEMRLMGTLKCKSDMHSHTVEQRLHRLFRREHFRGEWFNYYGHLPYVLSKIIKSGDVETLECVFRTEMEQARKFEKPKKKQVAPVEELSSIDHESLSHLRSIRAEVA
jgi:hypothetical protein